MSRNRSSTECDCGFPLPYILRQDQVMSEYDYFLAIESDPKKSRCCNNGGYGWATPDDSATGVHFSRHECLICGSKFALWASKLRGESVFKVYDSSYWHSFNDEPGEKDRPIRPDAKGDAVSILDSLQKERSRFRRILCAMRPLQQDKENWSEREKELDSLVSMALHVFDAGVEPLISSDIQGNKK